MISDPPHPVYNLPVLGFELTEVDHDHGPRPTYIQGRRRV